MKNVIYQTEGAGIGKPIMGMTFKWAPQTCLIDYTILMVLNCANNK